MAMLEGMSENSLLLEGASDVVLSLDEEGFRRLRLALLAVEESVRVLLIGRSLKDGRSC